MNILVTGANGQLGHTLTDLLTKSNGDATNKTNIYAFDKIELDITNKSALENFFSEVKIDLTVNCGAYTNVDLCESERKTAREINVQGVKNLAEIIQASGSRLVQISSDFVFDGKKQKPYAENDICNPLNFYGETKLESEKIVRNSVEKHFIVRTSSLYSIYQVNFVKSIIKAAKKKGEIVVVDDQVSCPTNAEDLAKSIMKLVETDCFGTYNIAGEGFCSKYEFACEIIRFCKINAEINRCKSVDYNSAAVRPLFSALDKSKIDALLGHKQRNWEIALSDFIDNKLKKELL